MSEGLDSIYGKSNYIVTLSRVPDYFPGKLYKENQKSHLRNNQLWFLL